MNPQELIQKAVDTAKRAHAPYSNYHVGSAILSESGDVFVGCNVENASYGLTNCAERTAIFSAVAAGQKKFTAIAIVAESDPPPFPCGACRQVMAEFCDPDMPVYVAPSANPMAFVETSVGELLPHIFKLK